MTLFRTIVVLVAALLIMLTVVILRAETTRLHYEISQQERRAADLRQSLRTAELELARLRNPILIRQKVEDAVQQYMEQTAESEPAP